MCIYGVQWRSHWGGKGGRVPPLTAKNLPKNQEKEGKIGKKRQKSGKFFHFAPPDRYRAGYATDGVGVMQENMK